MFVRKRKCIEIRSFDFSLCEGGVAKGIPVVNKREYIRLWIRLQRGKENFLRAADGGKRIDDESSSRFKFHSEFSISIPLFLAMKINWRELILFLLMMSEGPCRLNIVLLRLIGYQVWISQKLILRYPLVEVVVRFKPILRL